jgi:hypothetical protein
MQADFVNVYIIEAHPNDGWTLDNHNETRGELAWETERNRSERDTRERDRAREREKRCQRGHR